MRKNEIASVNKKKTEELSFTILRKKIKAS